MARSLKTYNGDCLSKMNHIADSSIDMVCCDLPYGLTASNWDKIIPSKNLWEHYDRLLKPTGTVALFASQPFTTNLINSNFRNYRYVWYWVKNQATNFFHAKRMPTRRIEEIVIFNKGKYNPQITTDHVPTNGCQGRSEGRVYYGTNVRKSKGGKTTRYPNNVLDFKCVGNYERLHPSQKPVELIEYLVRTYTDTGETVLDNAMGSGTTAIACKNTGRGFIGIEKDVDYYKIALRRIRQHVAQKENKSQQNNSQIKTENQTDSQIKTNRPRR